MSGIVDFLFQVLRKYQCLWSLHVPTNKRPKLYIVNLQWTPKDDVATCKINGNLISA